MSEKDIFTIIYLLLSYSCVVENTFVYIKYLSVESHIHVLYCVARDC